MVWKIFLCCMFLGSTLAQFYEDNRCRCVCPIPTLILNNTVQSDRTLYIAYVPPNQCNCHGVILPKAVEEIKRNALIYCPRCDCKYETRKTTVILVVVMFVVWLVMFLTAYYFFLALLEYLANKDQQTYVRADVNLNEIANLLIHGEDMDE